MSSHLKGDLVNVKFIPDQVTKCPDKAFVFHEYLRRLLFNDQTTLDQRAEERDIGRLHIRERILSVADWDVLTFQVDELTEGPPDDFRQALVPLFKLLK